MTAAAGTRLPSMNARTNYLHTDKTIIALSGVGAHLRALATAVDHQADRART